MRGSRIALAILLSVQFCFAQSGKNENRIGEVVAIRAMQTAPGLFLVKGAREPGASTTFGERLTNSFNPLQMKLAAENTPMDPNKDMLFLVGLPMPAQKEILTTRTAVDAEVTDQVSTSILDPVAETREVLADAGMHGMELGEIKRFISFMDEVTGLFVQLPNGLKKLSSAKPSDVQNALRTASKEILQYPLLMVGSPLMGKKLTALQDLLKYELARREISDQKKVEHISGPAIFFETFFANPGKILKSMWYRLIWNLGMRQDGQTPTGRQAVIALSKVVVNGTVAAAVMWKFGQPLEILFPVSVANAVLSMATGVFGTSINNWMTRTTKYFPEGFFRQVSFTVAMTWMMFGANEWARHSMPGIDILGGPGILKFLTHQLPTATFQIMWRLSTSKGLLNWRENRNATKMPDAETRALQSSVDMGYSTLMLPAYLMSVAFPAHDLFSGKIAGMDVRFSAWYIPMLAMAAWGLATTKWPKLIDGISKYTSIYDQAVGRFVGEPISEYLGKPITRFTQRIIKIYKGKKQDSGSIQALENPMCSALF